MNKIKKPLLFTLAFLPVAIVAGYFVVMYQLGLFDQATRNAILGQVGSQEILILVGVLQTILYACICAFIGFILSNKIGLMKSLRFKKEPLVRTLMISVPVGILFSLDYWIFGRLIPGTAVKDAVVAGMTGYGWLASILYGGIVEELMMRLFLMSLIAWLLWKLFFRNQDKAPKSVIIIANVVAALLFAAGHLPLTITIFDGLTPIVILRCFLLNGGFGLIFGHLYRKYGIQYAMMSHALLHIVSKIVWAIFV